MLFIRYHEEEQLVVQALRTPVGASLQRHQAGYDSLEAIRCPHPRVPSLVFPANIDFP